MWCFVAHIGRAKLLNLRRAGAGNNTSTPLPRSAPTGIPLTCLANGARPTSSLQSPLSPPQYQSRLFPQGIIPVVVPNINTGTAARGRTRPDAGRSPSHCHPPNDFQ